MCIWVDSQFGIRRPPSEKCLLGVGRVLLSGGGVPELSISRTYT